MNRLVRALYEAGAIVTFNWGAWRERHSELADSAFSGGSVADAARLVTAVVRGERSGDGIILEALNDGTMSARHAGCPTGMVFDQRERGGSSMKVLGADCANVVDQCTSVFIGDHP